MAALLLLSGLLALDAVVLDNDYVRVVRGGAPCAAAGPECGDRVLVALAPIELGDRKLSRGDILVFEAGRKYEPPSKGDYAEVAFKTDRPRVQSPAVLIAPEKNAILWTTPSS